MAENQDVYIDKVIRVALIAGIVAWAFQLIYPLLSILAWGFIIAVVFYPLYTWLDTLFGNHPILTATSITLCILLLVSSTTFFITNDVAQTINDFTTRMHNNQQVIPMPPDSIQNWPIIGQRIYQTWSSAAANLENEISKHASTLLNAGKYGLAKLLNTSKDFLFFIISIIFSGYLMAYADNFMAVTRRFAQRVADENGSHLIDMIRDTIQNISRGVIGISLLQTFIFWQLLLIANASGIGLLSLLAMILSIAQVGLIFLVIPVIIWLFFTKSFAFALIITFFLILDALLDSLLKPIILARGLSTPMMIIFIGVIGGILVYGMIGVFMGPVILAVAYDLLQQWIDKD